MNSVTEIIAFLKCIYNLTVLGKEVDWENALAWISSVASFSKKFNLLCIFIHNNAFLIKNLAGFGLPERHIVAKSRIACYQTIILAEML